MSKIHYASLLLFLCYVFIRTRTPIDIMENKKQKKTNLFYGPLDFVRDYTGELVPEPIWILLKDETVSGSGISWGICKSARRPRQPRQHHITQFFTGRMPVLLSNQQHQWRTTYGNLEITAIPRISTLQDFFALSNWLKKTVLLSKTSTLVEICINFDTNNY